MMESKDTARKPLMGVRFIDGRLDGVETFAEPVPVPRPVLWAPDVDPALATSGVEETGNTNTGLKLPVMRICAMSRDLIYAPESQIKQLYP